MIAPASNAPSTTATFSKHLIVATAMIALLNIFTALGDLPISRVQEVRVAETAQDMLARHDFLIPYFHGEIRLQKPPLAYWLAIAGYSVFGETHQWALRFFTACFALGSLFLLFRWIRRHTDVASACFSVACMVSCLIPLKMSRVAETDTPLLFFIIAAAALGYALLHAPAHKRSTSILFFCAMAFGMLSKGPPALAIPLGLLIITALLEKNRGVMSRLFSPTGWLLFLVIAFSWYAFVYHQQPDALLHTLLKETDDTYVTGDHKEPLYYYITRGAGYYAPWSLLVIPCSLWLWQQRKALPSLVQYACTWFVLVFCMLSFNANKQAHYSLLLAPPFAILMGHYLQHATGKHRVGIQGFCAIIAIACTLWATSLLITLPIKIPFILAGIAVLVIAFVIYKKSTLHAALILAMSGLVALSITVHALHKDSKVERAITASPVFLQPVLSDNTTS